MTITWDGDRASDGTTVEPSGDGFAARLAHGGVLRFCPCCDRPFDSTEKVRVFVSNVHVLFGQEARRELDDWATIPPPQSGRAVGGRDDDVTVPQKAKRRG